MLTKMKFKTKTGIAFRRMPIKFQISFKFRGPSCCAIYLQSSINAFKLWRYALRPCRRYPPRLSVPHPLNATLWWNTCILIGRSPIFLSQNFIANNVSVREEMSKNRSLEIERAFPEGMFSVVNTIFPVIFSITGTISIINFMLPRRPIRIFEKGFAICKKPL